MGSNKMSDKSYNNPSDTDKEHIKDSFEEGKEGAKMEQGKEGAEVSQDKSSAGSEQKKTKKHKDLKKKLLETLTEEEIKELLVAKEALEEARKNLAEKEVLLREYEELLKRKQADFENYRKRVQREIEENKKFANVEIILDIIGVLDDFERAIDSAKSSRDFDTLLEGIVMIENQLRGILEKKYGVKRIEAVGKEFDPNLHDAIMMEESDEYEEDTVVEDFQKGYIMHDRIIRPSKVKVAKAVGAKNPESDSINFKNANNNSNKDESIGEEENTSEKGE